MDDYSVRGENLYHEAVTPGRRYAVESGRRNAGSEQGRENPLQSAFSSVPPAPSEVRGAPGLLGLLRNS